MKNDSPVAPVVVPRRPPLPGGLTNYVTPRGLALLRAESANLEVRRAQLQARADAGAPDAEEELAMLQGIIAELQLRLATARVVEPPAHPREVVRFGTTVTVKTVSGGTPGEERRFTIVGVDEASAADGRLGFTSPLAHAVLGLHVGETGVMETPQGNEVLEVREIE